jgi:hypothetical protein
MTIPRNPPPEYLGDGVYASFDGYHLWLTTGSHEERDASNRIALEPSVYAALVRYQARAAAAMADPGPEDPGPQVPADPGPEPKEPRDG